MAALTTEEKALRRVRERFAKGVVDYGLLGDGDRVLVGVSGGKDSLALLELLAERARVWKPRFSVVAAHVWMSNVPYRADMGYLRDFAVRLGVELVCREASFDAGADARKSPCFLCSWNRRKALLTVAKEQGCHKIALGHHMDDVLETLLMNMAFQGSFSTMPPVLRMRKFDMSIIRPLCLVHEADLRVMARVRGYRPQVENCPYEEQSRRAEMKRVLARMEELNPEARYSLWRSMENVQEELLPRKGGTACGMASLDNGNDR